MRGGGGGGGGARAAWPARPPAVESWRQTSLKVRASKSSFRSRSSPETSREATLSWLGVPPAPADPARGRLVAERKVEGRSSVRS